MTGVLFVAFGLWCLCARPRRRRPGPAVGAADGAVAWIARAPGRRSLTAGDRLPRHLGR